MPMRCSRRYGNQPVTSSAIAKPAHGETFDVSSDIIAQKAVAGPTLYSIRGYAYAGGGRRINRVEISLDHGKTWSLADM